MMRYGFKLTIRPGSEEEYITRHQHVHKDLLNVFKECGIHTYSIFMDGTTLFGYIEADNIRKTMGDIEKSKPNIDWQHYMSDIIVKNNNEIVEELKEVFYFNGSCSD